MKKECVEIVLYVVHEGKLDAFLEARKKIMNEVKRFKGFISATTLRSSQDPNTFLDYLVWDNLEHAQKAFESFPGLPSAKAFMEAIKEVKFSDHMAAV